MDNSVIIKGSKSGITVFLDNEMPFEELLESVSDKFKNASKFFNNANMAISFDGRDLSAEEEKKILNIISDVSDLNIVCVLDENNDMKTVYEEAVKKAIASTAVQVPEPALQPVSQTVSDSRTSCMFYKGTLRSGQVFEADGSVVVLGDVNPGGKVVAKGSVIVLGSLKGNIFAGVDGNENAFVVALEVMVAPLMALIWVSSALPDFVTESSGAFFPAYWSLNAGSFAFNPRPGVSLISRNSMPVMVPSSFSPTDSFTTPP